MVLVSAEGAGILAADTWRIADADGIPYTDYKDTVQPVGNGGPLNGEFVFDFSYQWIRVDGGTDIEIGTNSPRYQLVDADLGKQIKVRVSFTDQEGNAEVVTSVPFGPIVRPAPLPSTSTLVGNTRESPTATKTISDDYAMPFKLGTHGQGYEISSVSIDLAAAPSSLTVSLWTGGPPGSSYAGTRTAKLFEFENPASFQAGLNEFTAPAGAFAYQNVDLWIVLSGFGSSLSITETTSDDEDAGGETGATLANDAGGDSGVLRLAVNGSRRTTGILAANFTYPGGNQEIISVGDKVAWGIDLGAADRYLIRGLTLNGDDTTSTDGGFDNPFFFRSDSLSGTKHFNLFQTRNVNGLPVWTAPQGATVAGSNTYVFEMPLDSSLYQNGDDAIERIGAILLRVHQVNAASDGKSDNSSAPGVSLHVGESIADVDNAGPTAYMAVHGVPLHAMVQNLGQTDDGYRTVGGTNKVLSQGFTTGSRPGGYDLQGIGVNIEGSGGNVPDDSASVSVAVHADSGGKPGAKLFDLLSPTEYAAGHSFFEAPRGTELEGNTSYVMVWSHLGGTVHRMRKTASNSEDSGALTGFSMANTFYQGADIDNMAADPNNDVLEIAVYASAPPPNATGRPVVLPSVEDPGVFGVDPWYIEDPDGIPNVGAVGSYGVLYDFSYRWIRVDPLTGTETVVSEASDGYRGLNSQNHSGVLLEDGRYHSTPDDIGKLLKVQVSFTDAASAREVVESLPFGPVPRPEPLARVRTLVANTAQAHSATETVTDDEYHMAFRLGAHGQGYDIADVTIELAAPPPSLTVSLWGGRATGSGRGGRNENNGGKLFEFEGPDSLRAGLNTFTAPRGVFAYQHNVEYYLVLSDFGSSLDVKVTNSDEEDRASEPGAVLANSGSSGTEEALRMAVRGSRRDRGILVSTYAQAHPPGQAQDQEIVSLGDKIGVVFSVGDADRYLIRGVTFAGDDSSNAGLFDAPWDVRDGTTTMFDLAITRKADGINEYTAPQGSTVEGGCTTVGMDTTCEQYNLYYDLLDNRIGERAGGGVLGRYFGQQPSTFTGYDSPKAAGVTIDGNGDTDFALVYPLMAIFGEPLVALTQNLGAADTGYVSVGGTTKVVSQGFSTGSDVFGYRLQGIGVDIEGSDDSNGNQQVPSNSVSVSVSVHTSVGGKPGAKLFDLLSPTEFAPGHSFFEAPSGTRLAPNTSYVMVWRYNAGTWHRLNRTTSDLEDSGNVARFWLADAYYSGADLGSLTVNSETVMGDTVSNALQIAVYGEVLESAPFVEGGIPVPHSWLHIPEGGADPWYQFRLLFVTHRGLFELEPEIDPDNKGVLKSDDVEDYNTWVRWEAEQPYSDPIIRRNASKFKAVVCTASVDAQTNTGMADTIGVPVHWLDGGWEDRPTLIARSNAGFYSADWINDREWGAIVTGNSTHFEEQDMVWTGCDATGAADPDYPIQGEPNGGMFAVGSPRDTSGNRAPIGRTDPTDPNSAELTHVVDNERLLPLYAISPVFTVVEDRSVLLPPRNLRGVVDSSGGLALSWEPPRGYAANDLDFEVWWRNPARGLKWEKLETLIRRVKMTVFAWTPSVGNQELRGYFETQSNSSLSDTTFGHRGTTYTVLHLFTRATKGDATDDPELQMKISPIPPGDDGTLPVTIEFLSGESFSLSDVDVVTEVDDDGAVVYQWNDTGLRWDDGEEVFFTLKDSDGNIISDAATEWTDDRYDRTYGVRAIDGEGRESPRVPYVCSEATGCDLSDAPN